MNDTPEKSSENVENPAPNAETPTENTTEPQAPAGDSVQNIESADTEAQQPVAQDPPAESVPQTPDHVVVMSKDQHPAFQPTPDTPATQAYGEVAIPGPEDDADIEAEVAQALGDMSLMDIDTSPKAKNDSSSQDTTDKKPIPGILRGTIYKIESDGVFITGLGGKSEGFLPKDEIEPDEVLKEGDPIDVCIVGRDPKDGLVILSRNAATQQIMLKNLKVGDHVEATVIGSNKGGLEMKIKGGIKAFMPISQIDFHRVEDEEKDKYIGQKLICAVTQADRNDRNIVVSRRKIVEAENKANADQLWEQLEQGQVRKGTVRSIMDYGAFVDLGGIDGLVHVSEISWAHIDKPSEFLVVGQQVEVFIKEINREKQRLALSIKLVSGDPWSTVDQKFPVGMHCQAKVVRLMNFGAFAQLEPGIEGLIPVSEMSWIGRVNHPKEVLSEGDVVDVEILKCSKEDKQISMSIKAVQGNPWENIEEKYMPESDHTGKVVRLSDFGAFVELEPGVDGLVHISELSDKHIKRTGDAVSEGEEVKVRVLEVDTKRKRIALSIKALMETPVDDSVEAVDETTAPAAKPKRKKNLKGGIGGHDGGDNPLGLKL